MQSRQVRQSFLDFFARHDHTIVPGSSLVPAQDPTLLFTNAGMNQFKDVFLGLEKRPYVRAATVQRCLRVSGKHNDLEEVGPSPRHHTFFEMLGNFSFGDYFKARAIVLAWELLTQVYGLSPQRLQPTVFQGDADFAADDEAARLWSEVAGIPVERVTRLGRKDNFWQMGDVGPAGPCSEIHYDLTGRCLQGQDDCDPICECGRWIEIWNLVFMQFELRPDGSAVPLPRPSVDTGAGFERIVAILQDVPTNYDSDLFVPIMDRLQEMLGHGASERARLNAPYRAVADHCRAVVNMIADGVMPGNVGRNSILRRILRRAVYQGRLLGFTGPFLLQPAGVALDILAPAYPHLREKAPLIMEVITEEEERFGHTLEAGLSRLETLLDEIPDGTVPGEAAFELYATYGYPVDLTRLIARQRGGAVDEAGFEAAVDRHHAVSRGQGAGAGALAAAGLYRDLGLPPTTFTGYETTTEESRLLALLSAGEVVRRAAAGEQLEVILERTPFYAESGGQVGDTGFLVGPEGRFAVQDTRRPIPDLVVHIGQVVDGYIEQDQVVRAEVDAPRRADIAHNHTATHLLHRALRQVLGKHVQQAGSLVSPDYLRFDFSHRRAMTPPEIEEVESQVNAAIRRDLAVVPRTLPMDEALQRGAVALFGEKYGETVRMISVEGSEDDFHTRELCGGTHVRRTGEIGAFFIRDEGSIGSGLRRIEGLSGRGAVEWARRQARRLEQIAGPLGVAPDRLEERLKGLLEESKERERQVVALQRQLAQAQVDRILQQRREFGGVTVIAAQVDLPDPARLREVGDMVRDRLGSGIITVASISGGRAYLVTMVTPDLTARGLAAPRILRPAAEILGGTGGGRPEMAQGGGPEIARLAAALAQTCSTAEAAIMTDYIQQENAD